jgi:hypothetical protein
LTGALPVADHQHVTPDTRLALVIAVIVGVVLLARRFSGRAVAVGAAVLVAGYALLRAGDVILVVLVGLAWFLIWLASLRINPRVAHRSCAGGRIYGKIFRKRFRLDPVCGGRGRVVSGGAALFGSPKIRAEYRAQRAAAREARRRGRYSEAA